MRWQVSRSLKRRSSFCNRDSRPWMTGNPACLQTCTYKKGALQELAGNVDDAILSYLMVDLVLGPQLAKRDANTQAEALYHLAKLWPLAGHPERATQAATSLQSNFAGSPWLTKLQDK
jgi:hypothetical protein